VIVKGLNEEKMALFVVEKFDDLKEDRKEKEATWLECFDAYNSKLGDHWTERVVSEGRSARFIGESFAAVESLHSQYMNVLFPSSEEWFAAEAVVPGKLPFDDLAATQVQALLANQLRRGFFTKPAGSLLRQLQIFGNAPVGVEWKQRRAVDYPVYEKAMTEWTHEHHGKWMQYLAAEEEWKKAVQAAQESGQQPPPPPDKDMPEPPRAGMTDVVDRYPVLRVGDIFSFVQDPFSMDPEDPLVIRHSWVTLAALKRMGQPNKIGFQLYENLEDLVEVDRRGEDDDEMTARYETMGLTVPEHSAIEVHEMFGSYEIPGARGEEDGADNVFIGFNITVANRTTVIRAEPTFLWSGEAAWFLVKYREPVGNEIYGKGQLEPGLGEQDLINARANQNIDIINHAIDPEFKAVDDDVVDGKLKSKPGRVRWVGSIENLVPLDKRLGGLNISLQDLEMLKNDFQRLTLSTSPLAGQARESATKSALDANSVSSEVTKIARYLEEHVFERILNRFMQYNAQFIEASETVKVVQQSGTAFTDLSPETIREGWAIKCRGAQHLVDRQERIQNFLMFLQLVSGNPVLLPAVNPIELTKTAYSILSLPDRPGLFNDEQRAGEIMHAMLASGMVGNVAAAIAGGQAGTGQAGSDSGAGGNPQQSGVQGAAGQDPVAAAFAVGQDLIG